MPIYPKETFNPVCILGVDASGDFRVLEVDANGRLTIQGIDDASALHPLKVSTGGNLIVYTAWDGSQHRAILVDAQLHPQVDVLTSALPTGASTGAKQDTMITALQLIDDLRNALASVTTDYLIMGGIDAAGANRKFKVSTGGNIINYPLWDGTQHRSLEGDASGHLEVSVEDSALPTGAATSAKQDTMITALQLIDDLRNALDSVGTDEIDVNVEASVLPTGAATSAKQDTLAGKFQDQVLSVKDKLSIQVTGTIDADGNTDLNTANVPSGEYWVVTAASCYNQSGVTTRMHLVARIDALNQVLDTKLAAATYEACIFHGTLVLDVGDDVVAQFRGGSNGDLIVLSVMGYKMTVAT